MKNVITSTSPTHPALKSRVSEFRSEISLKNCPPTRKIAFSFLLRKSGNRGIFEAQTILEAESRRRWLSNLTFDVLIAETFFFTTNIMSAGKVQCSLKFDFTGSRVRELRMQFSYSNSFHIKLGRRHPPWEGEWKIREKKGRNIVSLENNKALYTNLKGTYQNLSQK